MKTINNPYTTDHFPDAKITTESGSTYWIDNVNRTVSKLLKDGSRSIPQPCTYISDIELNNNFIFKTIYGDVVTTSPVITNIAESAKLIATTRSGSEYAFDLTKKTVSGPATNNLEVHYTNNLDLDVDKRVTVFAEQENNSIGFTTSPIVSIQSIKEYELLRNNTMDIENNMQLN